MKINEILLEDQQLNELPDLKAAGKAVARGAGTALRGIAKGAGALAGVPAGMKKAFQTGKQATTDFIGGATPAGTAPVQPAAPAMAPATAQPAAPTPVATTAQAINKAGPAGTAPAQNPTGAASQAIAKTAQAVAGENPAQVGQTVYAQVKSLVNQLDKKGKQRIVQLLQKSLQPATQQPAAPAMAAAPAVKRGQPVKISGRPTAAAPAAAPAIQTSSKINRGNSLNENFSFFRKQ